MGKHFVPQKYLRNFGDPTKSGFIWLHDKQNEVIKSLHISIVAQSKDFYPDETEKNLNQFVEIPGSAVIQKLIDGQMISIAERIHLARYIGVMLKRVPASRRKATELAPAALDGVISQLRQQLESLEKEQKLSPELLSKRLSELAEVEKKFQQELPPAAVAIIEDPWPSPQVIQLIVSMTWRILQSSGPQFFITTDNPAFFFSAYGLGKPESELVFPLSSTHALHGCWRSSGTNLSFLQATKNGVKEINRRLASGAERLAFYHEKALWLPGVLAKEVPYLSRILW